VFSVSNIVNSFKFFKMFTSFSVFFLFYCEPPNFARRRSASTNCAAARTGGEGAAKYAIWELCYMIVQVVGE